MFPNRAPVPPGSGSSYKLSIPETCDRIKEEFSYFQQQTHNFHVEREKIIQERSEMQRLCIMYYEMAHGLNLEMHRQMEIAKRLNAILNQLIPYLSQEHQGQISTAIERAKQVTMQELNSAMMHTEEAKCSKFFNGGNFGFPDQLEFYKHMLNAAATLNPSGGSSTATSGSSSASGFPLPSPAPLMSNSLSGSTIPSVPSQGSNVPPLPPVSASANASTLAAGAANFFANLMASGTSGFGQNALATNPALAGNPAAANFFLNASSGQQLNPNSLNLASVLLKQEADKHMNEDKQKNSGFSRPPSANDKLHNISRENISNNISEVHEKRRKLDMKMELKDEDEHYEDKRCNTFNGNGKMKDHDWRHMENLPVSPRSVGSSTPGLIKKKVNKNALDLSQGPGLNSSNDSYATTCSAPTTPATCNVTSVGTRNPETNNLSVSKSKNHSGKSMSQSSTKKHYNFVVKGNGSVEPRLMPIDTMTNSNQYPQHLRHLASFNHGEVVCAVALHQQTVFSGGKGTLKLWDINDSVVRGSSSPSAREPVASLNCLNSDSYIRSIKLINGTAAVIGGETNIIDIWDMAVGGSPLKKGEVKIDAPACYALTVAPDGKTCFSCFSDGNIAMIDIHNQTVINQFQAHVEGASCIEISSDGTYLWTGGLDSAVRAWDIRDCGRELKSIEFHAQIFSIGLTSAKDNRFIRPGYDWLAVGLENSDIDLVRVSPLEASVPPPQEHFRLHLHDNCVLSLRFAHHNDWFITTSKDHLINAITCPSGINILQTKEAGSVLTSDISADDKYVVTGSGDRKATLYDVVYPNSD